MRLVADVGGSNCRFALSRSRQVLADTARNYSNSDWGSFDAVLGDYLARATALPTDMVFAVAGPVHGKTAQLTNRNWGFDADKLARDFGVARVNLLNDLTALGYAVPVLSASQLHRIDAGSANQSGAYQALVVGIGTGFNVSPVLQIGDKTLCPSVEAGHVSLPSSIDRMLRQQGLPADDFTTVEDLFSGRGFEKFCRLATGKAQLGGKDAIALYGCQGAGDVTATIDLYAEMMGWLLRDLSLAYLPLSGFYLAGSVARAVLSVASAPCISVLQGACPIKKYAQVPLSIVTDDHAALWGCAQYGAG
ncbi:MAG: glucokinase [Paracoccaceae bacterium]|jgi:glucokinase